MLCNFDFAPAKNFVEKKSHRLLLREAVQRAENNSKPRQGRSICRIIPKYTAKQDDGFALAVY